MQWKPIHRLNEIALKGIAHGQERLSSAPRPQGSFRSDLQVSCFTFYIKIIWQKKKCKASKSMPN